MIITIIYCFQLHFCKNCRLEKEFEENVCTQCGLELIEEQFVGANDFLTNLNVGNNKRPYYLKTTKYDKFLSFLKPLKDFTRQLCVSLKCEKHILEGSLWWVEKVLKTGSFRRVRMATKHTVCACVVFLVCQSWNMPTSIEDVQRAAAPEVLKGVRTWKSVVAEVFTELGKFNHRLSMKQLASKKCESLKLGEGCCRRVQELHDLLQRLWVTEGVGAEGMAVACCHVAWVADAPHERWKVNFTAFCRKFGIHGNSTMRNHHHTILTALQKLQQLLPWNANETLKDSNKNIKKRKNKNNNNNNNKNKESLANVFFHFDDIIKYAGVLVAAEKDDYDDDGEKKAGDDDGEEEGGDDDDGEEEDGDDDGEEEDGDDDGEEEDGDDDGEEEDGDDDGEEEDGDDDGEEGDGVEEESLIEMNRKSFCKNPPNTAGESNDDGADDDGEDDEEEEKEEREKEDKEREEKNRLSGKGFMGCAESGELNTLAEELFRMRRCKRKRSADEEEEDVGRITTSVNQGMFALVQFQLL